MNQVMNISKDLTMSSKEIAELTGKNHPNVMRDIRKMKADLEKSKVISLIKTTTYRGKNGLEYPQYELGKDATLTLLIGYDTVARMKVVKRWQELEGQVQRPSVFDGSKMGNTLAAMEAFTRMTQTSESGKLLLFQNLQKSADLYDFLPSYAIDTPVVEGAKPVSSDSATALLKPFKVKLIYPSIQQEDA